MPIQTKTDNIARGKILNFKRYRKGWDYGGGVPFSKKTIQNALRFNRLLSDCGIPRTDAFPGANGSIMVVGYSDPWCWEFIVESNGTVTIVTEKNGSVVKEEENLSLTYAEYIARSRILRDLFKSLARRAKEICFSYEFLTPKTTITLETDLRPKHLSRLAHLQESQLLIGNVFRQKVIPSVPISNNITVLQPESPSFSGNLTNQPSLNPMR